MFFLLYFLYFETFGIKNIVFREILQILCSSKIPWFFSVFRIAEYWGASVKGCFLMSGVSENAALSNYENYSNPPILYYGINNHDLWPLRWRWCWQQGCAGSFGGSASSLPDWLAHRRMVWKVQQDNILALVSRDDYLANRYSLLCKHETESVGLGNCNSSLHPYLDNSPPGQFPTV